jgi:hypothetical protein
MHAGYQSAEHFSDANFFDTVLYHISGEAKEPEAGYDDCQTSKQTNQRSDPLLIAKLFGALLINKTILKRIIVYQQKYEVNGDGRKELIAGIDELIARQENAKDITQRRPDGVEYREIKSECEAKISEFSMTNHGIEDDLGCAIAALSSINGMVSLEDGKLNREMVGSMCI